MSQEVASFPYNDLEKILSATCDYFVRNEFLEECELYAKRLRPLYSSNLETFFSSILENYIYGDYREQVPFLNRLIEALVNLIRPRNKLCVKDKSGGAAEDIVEYVINCLIRDGLIPCFINSILINNRLSRIQRNFNYMRYESNWIANSNVYDFIREKDYWINSDYTSNKTSSSLQVAADDKPESLTESVIPENPAFTRKALKRPASHDLPDEELEWLRGTSACSNKDLPHSVEQNLSKNSLRMNNPCKTACLVCRHKGLRQSKIRKDCREKSTTRKISNELSASTKSLRKKSLSSLRPKSSRTKILDSVFKHDESKKEEHDCNSKPPDNDVGEEDKIEDKKQVSYVSIIIKEEDDQSKRNYSEEIKCETVENLASALSPMKELGDISRNTIITSQRSRVPTRLSVGKSLNNSKTFRDKCESTTEKISLGPTCTRSVCLKSQGTPKSISFRRSDPPRSISFARSEGPKNVSCGKIESKRNDSLRSKDLMSTRQGSLHNSILKNSRRILKSSLDRSCPHKTDLRSIDRSQVLFGSPQLENLSKVTCLKQPQASFNSSCLEKLQGTAIKPSPVKNESLKSDNEGVQRNLNISYLDKPQALSRNTCYGNSQSIKTALVKSEGLTSNSEVLKKSLQINTQGKSQASMRNSCYDKIQDSFNSKLNKSEDVSRCEGISQEILSKSLAEKSRFSKRNSCFEKSLSTVNESVEKSKSVPRYEWEEYPKSCFENSLTASRKSWPQRSNLNQTDLTKVEGNLPCGNDEISHRTIESASLNKPQALSRNISFAKDQSFLHSTPLSWSEDSSRCDRGEESKNTFFENSLAPVKSKIFTNKCHCTAQNTLLRKLESPIRRDYEEKLNSAFLETSQPSSRTKSYFRKSQTTLTNAQLEKSEGTARCDCGEKSVIDTCGEKSEFSSGCKICVGQPCNRLQTTPRDKCEHTLRCSCEDQTKNTYSQTSQVSLIPRMCFGKSQSNLRNTPVEKLEDTLRCDNEEKSKSIFSEKSQTSSRTKSYFRKSQITLTNVQPEKSEDTARCDCGEKSVKDTYDEKSQLCSGSKICVRQPSNILQTKPQDRCEHTSRCNCEDRTKSTCSQTFQASLIPKMCFKKSQYLAIHNTHKSNLRNTPVEKSEDTLRCDSEEKSKSIFSERSLPLSRTKSYFRRSQTTLLNLQAEKLEGTLRCDSGEKIVKSTFLEKSQSPSRSRISIKQSYASLQKMPRDRSEHTLRGGHEDQTKSPCLETSQVSSRSKVSFDTSQSNLNATQWDQREDHSTCDCEEVSNTISNVSCPHLDQSLRESPREESLRSKTSSGRCQSTPHNTRYQFEGAFTCNCGEFSRNSFGNKSRIVSRSVYSEPHDASDTVLDEDFMDSNLFENLQSTLKLQPCEKHNEKISLGQSRTMKTGSNKSQVSFKISSDGSQEPHFDLENTIIGKVMSGVEDEMPCSLIKPEKQSKENINPTPLVTKVLSISNELKCAPDAEAETIFDVLARLELSPYVEANNSELMSEIQELLCPILCERNQEYSEALVHVSAHSIGLQTEPKKVLHKEVSHRESEKNLTKPCKCLELSRKSKMDSLKASGDFVQPIAKNKGISVQKFSSIGLDSKLRSSNSKVFERKIDTVSRPTYAPSCKKVTYPVKKQIRRKRRKKTRKKEYKMKRSVITDFLCLPFTHVIRDMVYKILTERDAESSNDNKRKCNCGDGVQKRQTAPPNLKMFDSSYEDCHCSPRLDRKPFISCIKTPENFNEQSQVRQRLAGGSCEVFQKSSTQRKVVRPRSSYRKARILYCRRRSCVCESENTSSYIHTQCSTSAREDDSEIYSSYTRDCLTIYSRSINTSVSSDSYADVKSWCSTKRVSSRSSRRFTGRCRNEETRCECDIACGGMKRMRNVERRRTVCALPDENRSARYHSLRERKNHEPCHFCSDSSDKSGRRADTQPAGSSSKNQSHPERCSHRTKHKSAFNGQQHVEPEIIFDSRFQDTLWHL